MRRIISCAQLPIVYVQTVVGRRADGGLAVRGLFIGDDAECFHRAAELSLKVNFEMVDEPIKKAVVYLDPHEFHSDVAGQQGGLPDADGAGGWRGADYSGAGGAGVWRGQDD